MPHLKYNSFSYDPLLIIDFLWLTYVAFVLPDEAHEANHDLTQYFCDINKASGGGIFGGGGLVYYDWFYDKYKDSWGDSYTYSDFCQDEEHGLGEYLFYLDHQYEDLIQITYTWMAFDTMYFHIEDIEPIGIPEVDTYIFQFLNLNDNSNVEWINDPIEKRWWVDDEEGERHDDFIKSLNKERHICENGKKIQIRG